MDKMKPKFISQAAAKGHPEDKLEKIWKDWEAFAEYALINHTLPVMLDCISNSLSKAIIRLNIWHGYCLII
jgi:hypothetical protein